MKSLFTSKYRATQWKFSSEASCTPPLFQNVWHFPQDYFCVHFSSHLSWWNQICKNRCLLWLFSGSNKFVKFRLEEVVNGTAVVYYVVNFIGCFGHNISLLFVWSVLLKTEGTGFVINFFRLKSVQETNVFLKDFWMGHTGIKTTLTIKLSPIAYDSTLEQHKIGAPMSAKQDWSIYHFSKSNP